MKHDTVELDRTTTRTGGAFAAHAADVAAGNEVPGSFDANAEENYWRQNYSSRPYVTDGVSFNEYRPAYRYGIDAHRRYQGQSFEQVEPELMSEWDRFKGTSSLTWDGARHAARDSWQRLSDFLERAAPGDSDQDGK